MSDYQRAAGGRVGRLALVMLAVAVLIASTTGVLVRLSDVGPSGTGFWRMGIAFPILWLWMAGGDRGRATRQPSFSDFRLIALIAATAAAGTAVWNWSLQFTSVANATLLTNLLPIFVVLGGRLFLGHRFTGTFLVGMAVALTGAVILMGESVRFGLAQLLGDVMALLSAAIWGVYFLVLWLLRTRIVTEPAITWTTLGTAIFLFPIAALTEDTLLPHTLAGWAVVLALALFNQAVGHTMLTHALARLPAAMSAVGYLVVPALAAGLAWVVLDEPVGPWQALGAAIVLAGIVLARRGSR